MTVFEALEMVELRTKVVEVEEDGASNYTLKIDYLDGAGSTCLANEGFKNEFFQFSLLYAGGIESDYDPYRIARESDIFARDDAAVALMKALDGDKSLWGEIQHDMVLFPEDIEAMTNGEG